MLGKTCEMGRQPCCDKVGLKRGPWTIEEDHKLMNFILNNGIHCWRMVPKLAGIYIYISFHDSDPYIVLICVHGFS